MANLFGGWPRVLALFDGLENRKPQCSIIALPVKAGSNRLNAKRSISKDETSVSICPPDEFDFSESGCSVGRSPTVCSLSEIGRECRAQYRSSRPARISRKAIRSVAEETYFMSD